MVGKKKCPIVDTWWQTETGAIMISALPGAFPLKPGCATLPFFGVAPVLLDDKGVEQKVSAVTRVDGAMPVDSKRGPDDICIWGAEYSSPMPVKHQPCKPWGWLGSDFYQLNACWQSCVHGNPCDLCLLLVCCVVVDLDESKYCKQSVDARHSASRSQLHTMKLSRNLLLALQGEAEGILCLRQSWPAQFRTLFGDHKRYEEAYFSNYKVCISVACLALV